MSRWLKVAAVPLLLMVGIVGASGFIIRSLLSGSAKEALLARLSRTAGVPVRVESIDFDLAAWYRMRPALALRGVHVGNPPGYRTEALLTANAMQTQVALVPLFSGSVEVEGLRIEEPKFFIETGKNGATNLETFLKGLSGDKKADTPERSLSVQRFELSGGEIHIAGTGRVSRAFHGINLTLDDFTPARASRIMLATRLYDGRESRMTLEGTAGPFTASAIPVDGKLSATLQFSEIPAAVRREQFGELLADPGKGRLSIDGALKGDVYEVLSGSAKVALTGMQVGPQSESKLPLEGEAPATLSIRRVTSSPVIQAQVRNASIRLGSGTWKGAVDVLAAGGVVRGSSRGAISGVDINQFLTSFAGSPGKVSGLLTIPSYTVRFGGKDAAQIKRSLGGEGRVEVTKGQVKMLDLLAAIQRAIEGKSKEASAAGNTDFSTLTSDLRLGDQRLLLNNLALSGPALTLTGDGSIGFDQSLAMQVRTLVTGRIAELLGRRGDGVKPAEAMLPVLIGQTVSNPTVRPEIGKIAAGAAKGFFQDFLRRQLEKKSQPKEENKE
jgi:uncharacterized protein involved in outer membrane biogenesis